MKTYEVINVLNGDNCDCHKDCGCGKDNSLDAAMVDLMNTKLRDVTNDYNAKISKVSSDISSEASARATGDKEVEAILTQKIKDVDSKVGSFQYNIDNALQKTADLEVKLQNEELVRADADKQEAAARKAKDDELEAKLAQEYVTFSTALKDHLADVEKIKSDISKQISDGDKQVRSDLTKVDENIKADMKNTFIHLERMVEEAKQDAKDLVAKETEERKAADDDIRKSGGGGVSPVIEKEIEDLKDADKELDDKIESKAEEAKEDLEKVKEDLSEAIDDLDSKLRSEKYDREAGDTILDGRIRDLDIKINNLPKLEAGEKISIVNNKINNDGVRAVKAENNTLYVTTGNETKTYDLSQETGYKAGAGVNITNNTISVGVNGVGIKPIERGGSQTLEVITDAEVYAGTEKEGLGTINITDKVYPNNGYLEVTNVNLQSYGLLDKLIPSGTSLNNKLANEQFVTDKIASASGNLVKKANGQPFTSAADLQTSKPAANQEVNDYAIVEIANGDQITYYRYKVTVEGGTKKWVEEYKLGGTSFTAEQMGAINSTISADDVTNLKNHLNIVRGNPHGTRLVDLDDFASDFREALNSEGSRLVIKNIVDDMGSATQEWVGEHYKPLQTASSVTVEALNVVTKLEQNAQGVVSAEFGRLPDVTLDHAGLMTPEQLADLATVKAKMKDVEGDPEDPSDTGRLGELEAKVNAIPVATIKNDELFLNDEATGIKKGGGSAIGVVESIVAGDGILVDSTDPAKPKVSVDPSHVGASSFADLTGEPTDNTKLSNALDAKLDKTGIKTVAGQSLVGTGNVEFKTINSASIQGTGNLQLCTWSSGSGNPTGGSLGSIYIDTTSHNIWIFDGANYQLMNSYR